MSDTFSRLDQEDKDAKLERYLDKDSDKAKLERKMADIAEKVKREGING